MHPNDAAAIAEQFQGWMTTEELRWLANEAAKHQRILEIGTYAGRSTAAMALMCPGEILTIDTLVGELGTPELNGHALFELAHRNLASLDGACKVEQRRQSSGGLYMEWRLGNYQSPSLIFIDAAHDQSEVMFDLWVAKQIIAPGGVIAGHDLGVGGVIPALEIELPDYKRVAHSIWAWKVPEWTEPKIGGRYRYHYRASPAPNVYLPAVAWAVDGDRVLAEIEYSNGKSYRWVPRDQIVEASDD